MHPTLVTIHMAMHACTCSHLFNQAGLRWRRALAKGLD